MANHKSSVKRIRETKVRNLHNRFYAKTARNAVRKLRATTVKEDAAALYIKVSSMLDKLAKKNIIHKNKCRINPQSPTFLSQLLSPPP